MIDPYTALVGLASSLSRAFYDITHLRPRGVRAEIGGPAVVVANHPNALLDAVLVASSTPTKLSFLAKAPLFSSKVIGPIVRAMGALPVYRPQDGADTSNNTDTFRAVERRLMERGVVAIFPEGRSVDTTELLELRTGAARMIAGALASGTTHVDVVPVGIWFADKTRFRTEAATMRAPSIRVSDPDVDVRRLTEQIDVALRSVTVNATSHRRIDLSRNIVEFDLTPARNRAGSMARTARLLATAPTEEIDELERLFARSDWLGATPSELGHLDGVRSLSRGATLAETALRLPGALVGAVGAAPAFHATDRVARRFIRSPTDESMIKIGSGLLCYPAWGAMLLRALRAMGLAGPARIAAVATVWILHLSARPTFASLRARWSALRLAKRLRAHPSLETELEDVAEAIRRGLRELAATSDAEMIEPGSGSGAVNSPPKPDSMQA